MNRKKTIYYDVWTVIIIIYVDDIAHVFGVRVM